MKKSQLFFATTIAAMMSLTTISCQKEEILPPDVLSDTTEIPEEPEADNYVVQGTDTIRIHHVTKNKIFEATSGGSDEKDKLELYLNGHPNTSIIILFDDYRPGPDPMSMVFGVLHNNSTQTQNSTMKVDDLGNGKYEIVFADTYKGEAFEIHFMGIIYDVDKPAGKGRFTMNGITTDLYFNECQHYQSEYNLFFNNEISVSNSKYTYMRITLDSHIEPGTYNLDDNGFFLVIWNATSYTQYATNCTLTASRNGDNWELRVTGTLPDGDFEFTYTGLLNFTYYYED